MQSIPYIVQSEFLSDFIYIAVHFDKMTFELKKIKN